MDLIKVTIDKFFGFLAAVIPGVTVLIVFSINHPRVATTIRDINYLGYKTKLSLILAAAVIAGWTVTTFCLMIISAWETTVGRAFKKSMKAGWKIKEPPWRDKNWRSLVITYLGNAAPEDIDFISEEDYKVQLDEIQRQSGDSMGEAIAALNLAKAKADHIEEHWRAWWETFHNDVFRKLDPATQISSTIELNLQAASLVLLFAMPSTPVLQKWWLIAFCLFWLSLRVTRVFARLALNRNPWSTYSRQMDYLREHMPPAKPPAQAEARPPAELAS
jgi:hypothetical protein